MRKEQILPLFRSGFPVDGRRFLPLFYLEQVDEPDFGCEGRPEQGEVCGCARGFTAEGEKLWQIEEKALWYSGFDDDQWAGMLAGESGPVLVRGKTLAWRPAPRPELVWELAGHRPGPEVK